jgi:hypothetical protein
MRALNLDIPAYDSEFNPGRMHSDMSEIGADSA